jgi:xylulokinase
MTHVVAVDLGTSGLKVAVVDDHGRVVGAAAEPLPTLFSPLGGAEQDAEVWWAATGRCSRQALAVAGLDGRSVAAVAVTAQYMSIVAIDAAGRPLAPAVMWMDARGARHHRPVPPGDADLWIERHGLVPGGYDDHAHVAFLRAERPEVYAAAAAFVEPVDYLNARLCGRITATQNTAFPLIAIDNRRYGATEYDVELVSRAELDASKLPPLVAFDEILGEVTSDAAKHLGISERAVVVPGTIDSTTSAVGSGALDPRACSVVVGTTTVVVTHVDHKATDAAHGIISVPSPVPGHYFVMAENGVGGKALEFVLRNVVYADDALGSDPMPADAYTRAEAAAASVATGRGSPLFLPWLVGSMAPAPDGAVRGGFVNLGLTTSRADLVRAVYEGVALNAAWLVPHVAAFAAGTWDEVRFGGGAAASPLWADLLADALDTPVVRLAGAGSTNARGAAFLALARLGCLSLDDVPGLLDVAQRHEPDAKRAAVARNRLERFVEFHDLSRPFYSRLRAPSSS